MCAWYVCETWEAMGLEYMLTQESGEDVECEIQVYLICHVVREIPAVCMDLHKKVRPEECCMATVAWLWKW